MPSFPGGLQCLACRFRLRRSAVLLLLCLLPLAIAPAQPAPPPLLTLEDAVTLAMQGNRLVQNSRLEAEKYDFRLSTIRSHRLPEFKIFALESELFQPVDVLFKQGVFGTFPILGPIPSVDTTIRTPARLNSFIAAGAIQPLSQQYKIGLGIQAGKLQRQLAQEELRAERQKTAAEVRVAYYSLVETEAALVAAREAVTTLREALRVSQEYAANEAVLPGDVLDVRARLARQEYQLAVAEDGVATQSEHLNQLLGRDLATPFRVAELPPSLSPSITVEEARLRAFANRPELRQLRLKVSLAGYDRRLARAEYIPDVSLLAGYLGMHSIEAVPGNVALAGISLSWEPFDWGRRHNVVEEKSRTLAQARNGLTEAESQISVEVALRLRRCHQSELGLNAARLASEAATERLRVANHRFHEQAALIKDVLQAEAQREDAAYQYQQALAGYWKADADLRKSLGEE